MKHCSKPKRDQRARSYYVVALYQPQRELCAPWKTYAANDENDVTCKMKLLKEGKQLGSKNVFHAVLFSFSFDHELTLPREIPIESH